MYDWEIVESDYGRRFKLRVEWSDDFVELFKREDIQELELAKWRSSGWDSLDFLAEVPWLKSFTLLDFLTENIEGIYYLPELRSIYMSDYSGKPIDFLRFPLLKECRMEFTKNRISVNSCPDLELLAMQHFSYKDLTKLTSLSRLKTLDVAQGSLADISQIGAFQSLKTLNLVLLRSLKDFQPIANLSQIESVELEGSRGINSLDFFASVPTLRRLNIADCGNIESLTPLLDCKNLEILEFGGETNILDGNVAVLLQMPRLCGVRMANRKHYNARREDIPAYNISRYPEEWRYKHRAVIKTGPRNPSIPKLSM